LEFDNLNASPNTFKFRKVRAKQNILNEQLLLMRSDTNLLKKSLLAGSRQVFGVVLDIAFGTFAISSLEIESLACIIKYFGEYCLV
jgi:hypothetical protein